MDQQQDEIDRLDPMRDVVHWLTRARMLPPGRDGGDGFVVS
jgi:hypothetical protein